MKSAGHFIAASKLFSVMVVTALYCVSGVCLLSSHVLAADKAKPADAHGDAGGHGGGKKGGKDAGAPDEAAAPAGPTSPELPISERYCASIQDAAGASRLALQRKELKKAQESLEQSAKRVETRIDELKVWMKRREEFLNQAKENLTAIYAKMPAEAAATRIVAMNEFVAAAVLSKLPPKGAGAILAEMESAKAARLSSLLAGAADVTDKGPPPAPKVDP